MIASRRNLRFAGAIVFWIALVTLPLWLTHVGGYTALGTKILVYGIATLALNLLLGFTGGL